ncbi:MAG: helix-turn-helix transcriptional regulator [Lachnospiraceae bacterium]|nr:helix-turn-helix transcriptional regulator [Lachnospiraceae bacterium]
MKNQNQKSFEKNMVEKSTKYIDTFRKNIDMLMAEHDYTIKETAEIADISFDTLKTFLYDKEAKDCRLSTAVKLARAFHISIDELVGAGTFKPEGLEGIKAYRSLPEGSKRFLDWQVRNQKFIHEQQNSSKFVNVMLPLCAGNGNLKQTNDYEVMDITRLGDELTYKIFLGIKIPCLHYLPHYTEGDVLLIANDRDAMKGENTVVMFSDNMVITNRLVEHGEEHYYGLRDGRLRPTDLNQAQVIGYVAKIIRA